MSIEITTAFVKQYAAGVRSLQQQHDSRLRAAVSIENGVEGDRAFFDQVDATAMAEVTNRHGDVEYTDTPHRRRMVTLATYEVADLVDRADQRRLLNDPINPYSKAMAMAANRQLDDLILAAFDASASTGVDGATSVVHPAAFQLTESGGATTFDVGDLRIIRELLEANENMEDDDMNSWHGVLSADARNKLLGDTEVTSADYNTIRALVQGQINSFMGFNFIKSQRSAITAANLRSTFFWVKQSMKLAIGEEPRAFIDPIPTKRHSIQVRYELDAGATRMDEKGVVRIQTDET